MGRIQIESGLQRDEVVNQYGDQIGVAVYDLDDPQVRVELVKMSDKIDALVNECNGKADALNADESTDAEGLPKNALALAELNVYMVDEMIKMVDAALGDGFSARAIGATNKNPYDLWAVVQAVGESYGVKAKAKMDKYVNRAARRAPKSKP